jgi:SSS family solute:Na+ symporter
MIVWAPCVLIGIWATTQNIPPVVSANGVLAFLVKSKLSTWLAGLLTAGILAAIMSSLDSQFLCVGSMFTNDIVEHYIGKERLSDTAQVWIARAFVILIVAVTYWLSLKGYKSVFTLGVWCFSGFASLFPLVFAALYWRKLTAAGALSAVLAMVGSWLYLFRDSGWGADTKYVINVGGFEIMPVVAIFMCTLVAMVATSLMTSPPSEKTLAKFFGS